MKNWRLGGSSRRYLVVTAVLSVVLVWSLAGSDHAGIESGDRDGDGMSDDYEIFYGLNPTNPADAAFDYDGDLLINREEAAKLTDPFSPDTDRDLFFDSVDSNAISRAYIRWGDPRFTEGDYYDYAHPDFLLRAYKNHGAWLADTTLSQTLWRVASSESLGVGSLSLDLDRAVLTNNLIYALHYRDASNASMRVDLLSSNGAPVAEDLYGNLMGRGNAEVIELLAVPLVDFPEAAVIHLRREMGEISVYQGLLYIDEEFDGLDSDQERQLMTSDYAIDSNGNGISDYDEWFATTGGGSSTNNPPGGSGGSGGDGNQGNGNNGGIIYIDQAIGDDSLTGYAPTVAGRNGPKKTIHRGLAALEQDGARTLIINSGDYGEDLDLRGKGVAVVIAGRVKL